MKNLVIGKDKNKVRFNYCLQTNIFLLFTEKLVHNTPPFPNERG